jgi:glycosyltransferase involved in cell wall biosynthesis
MATKLPKRSAEARIPMRPFLTPASPVGLKSGATPTFSVIIAAHQAAETIAETLDSAFAQTLPPHEVIVCDDGSSDDLETALRPYRDRMLLLRQENRGEAGAKNTASRAARGDFVAILDADDVYLPERLEALGELAASRPDLDILTTDALLMAGGRVVRRAYDETWTFETADQRRAILERNFILGHAAVRRQALLDAGGFDESIRWTTDWDLWLRMIVAGGSRAGLVDEPLAEYRLHEGALSARRPEMLRGRVVTLEKAAAAPHELLSRERRALQRALETNRRAASVEEARRAILEREPDARRRSLRVALEHGHDARTRLKALAVGVAPAAARRLMEARDGDTWVGAAGVRVRR